MRLIFLSLFVLLPVIEIALFVQIGSEIGAMATVALVLGGCFSRHHSHALSGFPDMATRRGGHGMG